MEYLHDNEITNDEAVEQENIDDNLINIWWKKYLDKPEPECAYYDCANMHPYKKLTIETSNTNIVMTICTRHYLLISDLYAQYKQLKETLNEYCNLLITDDWSYYYSYKITSVKQAKVILGLISASLQPIMELERSIKFAILPIMITYDIEQINKNYYLTKIYIQDHRNDEVEDEELENYNELFEIQGEINQLLRSDRNICSPMNMNIQVCMIRNFKQSWLLLKKVLLISVKNTDSENKLMNPQISRKGNREESGSRVGEDIAETN